MDSRPSNPPGDTFSPEQVSYMVEAATLPVLVNLVAPRLEEIAREFLSDRMNRKSLREEIREDREAIERAARVIRDLRNTRLGERNNLIQLLEEYCDIRTNNMALLDEVRESYAKHGRRHSPGAVGIYTLTNALAMEFAGTLGLSPRPRRVARSNASSTLFSISWQKICHPTKSCQAVPRSSSIWQKFESAIKLALPSVRIWS
jgi:hypothetical protein